MSIRPISMLDAANMRQEDYEKRRRIRLLGLAIDQCITGMKNIIIYSDPKFWHEDNKDTCEHIINNGKEALLALLAIEKELMRLADIYISMIPNNQELAMYREQNANPTEDKN